MSNAHVETVKNLYAAFEKGDMPTIVGALHPDVRWGINIDPAIAGAQHPLFQTYTKNTEVPGFFEALVTVFEPQGMDVKNVAVTLDGKGVVFFFDERYKVRSSGVAMKVATVHHWTFDDAGKVVSWVGYTDTASELRAVL